MYTFKITLKKCKVSIIIIARKKIVSCSILLVIFGQKLYTLGSDNFMM